MQSRHDASNAYRGRASSPRHRTPAIQRMVRALREWKRVEEPHFRQDAGASMERVVQIDYSFYGSTAAICSEKEAVRKVLVAVDTDTGMAYQIMCRTKGLQDQYVVAGICKFLTDLRCSDIVLQSDGEHPIRSIVAAIAQTAREKHGLVIRERRAPKFSHQSQGSVEAPFDIAEDTFARCAAHWKMEQGWRFRWHMTLLLGWYDTLVG